MAGDDQGRLHLGGLGHPLGIAAITARTGIAIFVGVLALILAAPAADGLMRLRPDLFDALPWAVAANHTGMLIAALLLILVLSRGRVGSYGLRLARGAPFGRIAALSVAASAAAFGLGRLLPGAGLTFVREYSFAQQVLLVWVHASVAEEVLTRGLIQSTLAALVPPGSMAGRWRISLPVATAALFFGAVHLGLLGMGIDLPTVMLVVVFAIAIGLVAGHYREKTGSLIPAIAAHGIANMTGSILGLL